MNKLLPALIALALVAVPATVTAQDASASDHVETTDEAVTITYEREVGDLSSEVELAFSTNDTTYAVSANATSAEANHSQHLETQLQRLVEYEDEDGDGEFDQGDTVVSGYMLSGDAGDAFSGPATGQVDWEDLETTTVTTADGTEGQRIIARGDLAPQRPTSELPDELPTVPTNDTENGTIGLDLYVFGTSATYNGTELSPTEVKIDLTVKDYPYVENGTQLALIQHTETTSSDKAAQPEDGQGVQGTHEVQDVRVGLLYAWDDQARVNDTQQPVTTSLLANQTEAQGNGTGNQTTYTVERTHALSYARGDLIVHDPRTGVELEPTTGGTLDEAADTVPGLTALAALAALGTAVAVAARRR